MASCNTNCLTEVCLVNLMTWLNEEQQPVAQYQLLAVCIEQPEYSFENDRENVTAEKYLDYSQQHQRG